MWQLGWPDRYVLPAWNTAIQRVSAKFAMKVAERQYPGMLEPENVRHHGRTPEGRPAPACTDAWQKRFAG